MDRILRPSGRYKHFTIKRPIHRRGKEPVYWEAHGSEAITGKPVVLIASTSNGIKKEITRFHTKERAQLRGMYEELQDSM